MNISNLLKKIWYKERQQNHLAGEPTRADVDVTLSIYQTTSPLSLVEKRLKESNFYKQKIPFEVPWNCQESDETWITFDIALPETKTYSVGERKRDRGGKTGAIRQDPSEKNNRYLRCCYQSVCWRESFAMAALVGFNAGMMARQRWASFWLSILNDLASDLIAGVEINFDSIIRKTIHRAASNRTA